MSSNLHYPFRSFETEFLSEPLNEDFDAAVYWEGDKCTYKFKKDLYTRIDSNGRIFQDKISNICSVFDGIDAISVYKGTAHFYRKDKYCKLESNKPLKNQHKAQCHEISELHWPLFFSSNIDAVIPWPPTNPQLWWVLKGNRYTYIPIETMADFNFKPKRFDITESIDSQGFSILLEIFSANLKFRKVNG